MKRKDLKRFKYNEYNELVEDANGSWIDADEADAVMDAQEARIKELEASQPKWVSVKERLPKEEEDVMCIDKDKYMYFAYHETYTINSMLKEFDDAWWNKDGGLINDVTHWMPLPELPKEE